MGRPRARKRTRALADLGDDVVAGEGEGEGDLEEPAGLFPVGAEVEVRSEDQGFTASFYEATVTGHLLPSGRGYAVAYSTLAGPEDRGSPHREEVDAANVRPRPPPATAPAPPQGFAVHELVEAQHNDGWWAGVVCGLPEPAVAPEAGEQRPRRVYTVCFPTSREVLEFEETALRPRRVFRGDRWVPAAEKSGSPAFREGNQVEVSRSAKIFGQYWSPATVLKVIGGTSFIVQYEDAGEDGELITEIIDAQYIRPARNITHMDSKYNRFPPSSYVEVFHESSWWPGVILKVLDNELIKKFVVKIKSHETDMGDVECVDVLTVEHTQLRPLYDWHGRKWVRCLTEKQFNKELQLPSGTRPITAPLAPCNDSNNISAMVSYNESGEVRDEHGSSLKEKVSNADVVMDQDCPDVMVCDENGHITYKPTSDPEKAVKHQNTGLTFESHLALPSQSLVTGFDHLKYDSKHCLNNSQLELSSSRVIATSSSLQTAQFHASLFGAFGQLRPLPQGPSFGIQSLHPDFSSVVGSKKPFSDLEKQSSSKDCYLMAGTKQNVSVGSFVGIGRSRKRRKEYVSFQTPEGLAEHPETVVRRTKVVDKKAVEASNNVLISEEPTKSKIDDAKKLANDATSGSGILSESHASSCTDSMPVKSDTDSQENSVFLRESSLADETIPSGVPIGTDELQQEDYTAALQDGVTKDTVPIETSVLSTTSILDDSCGVDAFPSDSITQFQNKKTNADKSELIMDHGIGEESCQLSLVMADDANVGLPPSGGSCKSIGDDQQLSKDNMEAVGMCATNGSVPTENVSGTSLGMFSGMAPILLPSSESLEDNKKDGMGQEEDQGTTSNTPKTQHASADSSSSAILLPALKGDITLTQNSTMKFADNEQHRVSQLDQSSSMVEYEAEGSQSIEKSALTQLSSTDTSNSTVAQPGDGLILPKDAEGTPMSKYVPSRTRDSCCALLQRRPFVVHESVMADQPSESMATENLPFVKTSPLWVQIEAMEVFRKVPQRPNFHQFQQHVPELREGMALGLMLSFANLAESIKRLNIQDENALFEEKMKGLSSLEAHGFDVRHLRSRLETLLHIKNGRAEVHDVIKGLKEKIAHKETGERQIETKIGMLNMTVRQLELHTYLSRCIIQSAVSQMIEDASEISLLKAETSKFEQSDLSAEQRFGSVVTAPW